MKNRGARDLAHRVLQVAGQMFRHGIATGRCERDLSDRAQELHQVKAGTIKDS
jgi:hypothetical protein